MGTSLNPKDQVKGGLIQDVDATLDNCHFEIRTYANGDGVVMVGTLNDGETEVDQWWSVGSTAEWAVSEDGLEIDQTHGKTGTNDNSNFSYFMRELEPAGFPVAKIQDKISVLNGLKAHWIRKPQPARAGLSSTNDRGQEKTVLVPEKVLAHPLIGGKAKPAGTATGKTAPATVGRTAAAPANGKASSAATSAAESAPTGNDMENEEAVAHATRILTSLIEQTPGKAYSKSIYSVSTLTVGNSDPDYKALPNTAPLKQSVNRLLRNQEFLDIYGAQLTDKGDVVLPAAQ